MIDERFVAHRLKATRLSAVTGAVALGGWYVYHYATAGEVRYDILSVLILMAVAKVGAMIYYRRTD